MIAAAGSSGLLTALLGTVLGVVLAGFFALLAWIIRMLLKLLERTAPIPQVIERQSETDKRLRILENAWAASHPATYTKDLHIALPTAE